MIQNIKSVRFFLFLEESDKVKMWWSDTRIKLSSIWNKKNLIFQNITWANKK